MVKVKEWVKNLVTYKPGKPIEYVAKEIGIEAEEIVKLASNENSMGASPAAVAAIRNNIDSIYKYPDGSSYDLINKLAGKYLISSEQIVVGNGSDEIINLIYSAFCEKGDKAIMAFPSFAEYLLIGMAHRSNVVKVPLVDFKIDLAGIKEAIDGNTRIVFLNSPNNPTGTIIEQKELEAFMKAVPDDILVVLDEAYYEYATGKPGFPESVEFIKRFDNLLILRTFSKAYGLAGLRIGYGMGSSEIIDAINKVRQPFNVNRVAQIAAGAALEDTKFISETRTMNETGMNYLKSELKDIGVEYVESYANFLLIDLKTDADSVSDKLLKRGVIVRSMSGYGLKEFVRVTVGNESENRKFVAALKSVMNEV